jgi:hypothetical protein
MKGLGLQRSIFSLGEVSEPTNSKDLLGGEEAFSNEKRQGWKLTRCSTLLSLNFYEKQAA